MIKEFDYTSSRGTRRRKVFVIKDTAISFEGIDLDLIPPEDVKYITEHYKNFIPVKSRDEKPALDGFNPLWNKAYRQYKKSKIS